MSLHRRNPRRDLTEPIIFLALMQAGFSVQKVSVENGPDAWIGRNGIDKPVECKTGTRKLKPGQTQWAERWRGAKPLVLRTIEDAERVIASWPFP